MPRFLLCDFIAVHQFYSSTEIRVTCVPVDNTIDQSVVTICFLMFFFYFLIINWKPVEGKKREFLLHCSRIFRWIFEYSACQRPIIIKAYFFFHIFVKRRMKDVRFDSVDWSCFRRCFPRTVRRETLTRHEVRSPRRLPFDPRQQFRSVAFAYYIFTLRNERKTGEKKKPRRRITIASLW